MRLSFDEHKATLMNLNIETFYLPFVFCSIQSHLKTSEPELPAGISETCCFKLKNVRHKQTSSNQGAHACD